MKKIIIAVLLLLLLLLCISITSCTTDEKNENKIPGEEIPDENIIQESQENQNKTYEIISENIIVGKGTEWELKGKLTLPKDVDGKVPAVVLVHGSGSTAGSMNGTLFDNSPFRDIAEYLSSHGIAVIRYDKRTFAHALKIVELQKRTGDLTLFDETIEDAILATEILKSDPRINSGKVFIAGLSMGGMLAPRIHTEGGNYAGIISLSGSPRSIHDIVFDQQMKYWESMPDSDEKDYALSLAYKERYDAEIESLLNLPDDEAVKMVLAGGVTAYYYKDWEKISTPEYVKNITIPFLIMQGSADFQVFADKDFVAWQELLTGRQNVTFKLYEGLNHIFMKSTTGDMEEYKIPGHVDAQVLADIADWIKAN